MMWDWITSSLASHRQPVWRRGAADQTGQGALASGTGRTLYLLDEPTTGLHFHDIRLLLKVLQDLVDRGNTVLVIEHNLDVIKAADWLIDIGPEGGRAGGEFVFTGTPDEIVHCERVAHGQSLAKHLAAATDSPSKKSPKSSPKADAKNRKLDQWAEILPSIPPRFESRERSSTT